MVASANDLLLDWLIWNNDDVQRHVCFGTIMENLFNSSFNLRIKNKGDLKIQLFISFGSELKLIYN